MQITCPNCTKIFEVRSELIPIKGRLLQCSSCNQKWFYELNTNQKSEEVTNYHKNKIEDLKYSSENKKPKIKNRISIQKKSENEKLIKEINSKNINYFKIFFVIIITFVAIIITIDSFKNQLINIYPNLDTLLLNLYETFKDIKLFLIDLIK